MRFYFVGISPPKYVCQWINSYFGWSGQTAPAEECGITDKWSWKSQIMAHCFRQTHLFWHKITNLMKGSIKQVKHVRLATRDGLFIGTFATTFQNFPSSNPMYLLPHIPSDCLCFSLQNAFYGSKTVKLSADYKQWTNARQNFVDEMRGTVQQDVDRSPKSMFWSWQDVLIRFLALQS